MKKFEDFHPVSLLLYFFVIIFVAMFIMETKLVVAAWLGGTIYLQFFNKKIEFKIYIYTLAIVIVMAVVNMLVSHGGSHILFFINDRAITMEAGGYGIKTGFMLMGTGLWFYTMSKVITTEKWQCIFRRMPKLALLFSTILNLLPRYVEKFKRVQACQRINGDNKDDREGLVKICSGVFTWALENGVKTAQTMEMKGFNGAKVIFSPFEFKRRDLVFILVVAIAIGLFFTFSQYRYLIAFVYGCMPIIYTGKESVRFWIFSLKK